MEQLVQFISTSFTISFVIMPITIRILQANKILDSPNERKLHSACKPSLGGLPILIGFLCAVLLWMPLGKLGEYKYFLGGVVFMSLLGLRDDLFDLRARQKLVGQIIAALFICSTMDIRLSSFNGLFGLYEIPLYLSYTLTIFTIIVITNAFNLIDGIDGFAGSVAVIVLTFFGVWFFLVGEVYFSLILFALVGSVIGFLFYNWYPSKIFMGDTGSLVLGFTISIAAVYFIEYNSKLLSSHIYKFNSGIFTAIGVLSIPLYDTIRVFVIRVWQKKSPLLPDNNHIHHSLLKLKFSHGKSTLILCSLNVVVILLVVAMKDTTGVIVFSTTAIILSIYSAVVKYLVKTNKLESVSRLRLIKSRRLERESA